MSKSEPAKYKLVITSQGGSQFSPPRWTPMLQTASGELIPFDNISDCELTANYSSLSGPEEKLTNVELIIRTSDIIRI